MHHHYSIARKRFSEKYSPIANKYYRDYFDVNTIMDIGGSYEGSVFDVEEAEVAKVACEMVGVDKAITVDDENPRIIYMAERVRPPRKPDFSMCIDSGESYTAELKKYLNGIERYGAYPRIYGYGNVIVDDGEDIDEFYLIDFEKFLRLYQSGDLDGIVPPRNNDGRQAEFFPTDFLEEKG